MYNLRGYPDDFTIDSDCRDLSNRQNFLDILSIGNCLKGTLDSIDFKRNLCEVFEKYNLPASTESLEKIHLKFTPEQITDIMVNLRVDSQIINLQNMLMQSLSDYYKLPMYLEQQPNVRFHFPHKYIKSHQKKIEKRVGTGQLTSHSSHKDSYFYHPRETYNLWISITHSSRLNGMFVKLYSREMYPFTRSYRSDFRDISWLNIFTDLKPFEFLLFPAENIHGSILNTSNTTRVAFSMRFSLYTSPFDTGL